MCTRLVIQLLDSVKSIFIIRCQQYGFCERNTGGAGMLMAGVKRVYVLRKHVLHQIHYGAHTEWKYLLNGMKMID